MFSKVSSYLCLWYFYIPKKEAKYGINQTSDMAWGWPEGLFLSPEREHVVSTCWLTGAGYTQDTDGCERHFSFEVFVKDGGLKKALWRQDHVLFEPLSYMERRSLCPQRLPSRGSHLVVGDIAWRLLSVSCVSRISYGIDLAGSREDEVQSHL